MSVSSQLQTPQKKHIKRIGEILKEWETEWETFTHLTPDMSNNRTANFYLFPKIHKKEVKGRPIISSNGCPTEKKSLHSWMTTSKDL